jgi:hypothetical protein
MSKESGIEKDEYDMMLDDKEMNKSLSEKIGINKKELFKKTKAAAGGGGGGKKKKTKSPWSDDESGEPVLQRPVFKGRLKGVPSPVLKQNSVPEFAKPARGRCYDHNFLRFFPIFGEKNWRFSRKPML